MTRDDLLKIYLAKLPAFQALFRATEAEALANFTLKGPVLDLGCGDGIFTEALLKKSTRITGLDINPRVLPEAKKRKIYHKLVIYDGLSLPFGDSYFQTVLSNSVLEHVENIGPLLREISRVLKKGGTLVLTAPSEKRKKLFLAYRLFYFLGFKKLASFLGTRMNKVFVHINCFSGKRWEKELKSAGFTQVDYFYKASPTTAVASDLLLFLAPLDFLEKKLFGHYLSWRKYTVPLIFPILMRLDDRVAGEEGVVIVVKAEK